MNTELQSVYREIEQIDKNLADLYIKSICAYDLINGELIPILLESYWKKKKAMEERRTYLYNIALQLDHNVNERFGISEGW